MVRHDSQILCDIALRSSLLITALTFVTAIGTPQQWTLAQGAAEGVQAVGEARPPASRLRLGTSNFSPPSSVCDIALSPDGTSIVSVGEDLIVWDARTGKERWRAKEWRTDSNRFSTGYGIRTVAFSSDSSQFYTPGNSVINSWNTTSGEHRKIGIEGAKFGPSDEMRATSIDVTNDRKKFALGGVDGLIVCDEQGKCLFQIDNKIPNAQDEDDRLSFTGEYSYGRFSPDGRQLAIATSNRPQEIRFHDADSGRELNTIKLTSKLVRMDFAPDGKQIVATERDSAVRLYDLESRESQWSHIVKLTNPFENYTSGVVFSPDGKTIAAGATDNRIHLIDARTGEEAGTLIGHHWYPWTLAFSSDSKTLYSSGWDKVIRSWDVVTREQLPVPEGIRATAVVTISPDGQCVAYADDTSTVRIVDAVGGTERRTFHLPGMAFSQLLFSPDSHQLAVAGDADDKVRVVVWDATNGKQLHLWSWPKGNDPHSTVESLSFTPDGQQLAAAVFRQDAAYVWNLTTGEQIAELKHRRVYGLSFSADGKTLATAGWDSIVRFWETSSWSDPRELKIEDHVPPQGNDLRMYTVCCSPDGRLVATAHLNGKVRIWQAKTLELRGEFQVPGRFVYGAMDFSPDGLWLVTGAMQGQIELWDSFTAKKAWGVGSHDSYVYTVRFGRDSRTLVSGGDDNFSYVWRLGQSIPNATQTQEELWEDLAGDSSEAAYRAMSLLSEPSAQTVGLIAAKLKDVESTLHPEDFVDSVQLSAEEIDKKVKLMRLLTKKNPKVMFSITARRAISVLGQIGTPEAKQVLEELSQKDPSSDVAPSATAELKRLKSAE